MSSDKRQEQRVTLNKEFESLDAFVNEYVANVSRTGAFVRSQSPLAVGTKVQLCFTVVMEGVHSVEGIGEVVRVHDDPPGMGVVFTEMPAGSQAIIERLLTGGSKATT